MGLLDLGFLSGQTGGQAAAVKGGQAAGNYGSDVYNNIFNAPMVNRGYAKTDKGTEDLVAQSMDDSNLTPDELAAKQMHGTEQAKDVLQTSGTLQQGQQGLGGPGLDQATAQALVGRQNNYFGGELAKIKNEADYNKYQMAAQKQHIAAQRVGQIESIKQGVYDRQIAYDSEVRQQRSMVINNVLGTATSAIGAYAGSNAGKHDWGGGGPSRGSGSRQGGAFSTPGSRGGEQEM